MTPEETQTVLTALAAEVRRCREAGDEEAMREAMRVMVRIQREYVAHKHDGEGR